MKTKRKITWIVFFALVGCMITAFSWSNVTHNHASGGIDRIEKAVDPKKEGIQFVPLSYADALKMAKKNKKPLFIDCYTVWCGPCKVLAAKTFTNKEVGDFFNENFINLKVEMERDVDGAELARLFGVRAYPTLLFINGDGKLIKQSLGYVSPSQLLAIAKEVGKK